MVIMLFKKNSKLDIVVNSLIEKIQQSNAFGF